MLRCRNTRVRPQRLSATTGNTRAATRGSSTCERGPTIPSTSRCGLFRYIRVCRGSLLAWEGPRLGRGSARWRWRDPWRSVRWTDERGPAKGGGHRDVGGPEFFQEIGEHVADAGPLPQGSAVARSLPVSVPSTNEPLRLLPTALLPTLACRGPWGARGDAKLSLDRDVLDRPRPLTDPLLSPSPPRFHSRFRSERVSGDLREPEPSQHGRVRLTSPPWTGSNPGAPI